MRYQKEAGAGKAAPAEGDPPTRGERAMRTQVDLNQRNFYATWFNLLAPARDRRKGYGVFGVAYLPSDRDPQVLCAPKR